MAPADEVREDRRHLIADPTVHERLRVAPVAQTSLSTDRTVKYFRQRQVGLVVHLNGKAELSLHNADGVFYSDVNRLARVEERVVVARDAVWRLFDPAQPLLTAEKVIAFIFGTREQNAEILAESRLANNLDTRM